MAWRAENRASFILEKLEEGYDNVELRDKLGFSVTDIQAARQTRAIADMARSLPLPEEIKAKLENRRSKLFTTLGRVFESTVGRDFLQVEPDVDHGIKGTTTSAELPRGFQDLLRTLPWVRSRRARLIRTTTFVITLSLGTQRIDLQKSEDRSCRQI